MAYNNNYNSRRNQNQFVPSEKLAETWNQLRGYGVYPTTRQGEPYEWATTRRGATERLQEVQKEFGLSNLNASRTALLGVPQQYNGQLEDDLSPVRLRKELWRVRIIRTILLTYHEVTAEELEQYDSQTLKNMRGDFRDHVWREPRQALRDRIQKIKNRAKKKGKIQNAKGKGGKKRNNNRKHAKAGK